MRNNFTGITVLFVRIILSLSIILSVGGCTKQEPIASFSVNFPIIEQGGSVQFTDQSINNPTSWEWSFSGGTPGTSNEQNPLVTYENAGKHVVSLRVSNGDGSDAVQRDNCITVNLPAPVAAFTADKTSLDAGGTVQFTDQSLNEPTDWFWSFEGGTPSTSELKNPSVQYLNPGSFSVSLLTGNTSGTDYLQKDGYINVTQTSTSLTIYNKTHTEIEFEIFSQKKQIPYGGSVTYYGHTPMTFANYYASTSGETSTGTKLGYELIWENTIRLSQSHMNLFLDVGSSFYFLYLQNGGSDSFSNLQVGIMDIFNGFVVDKTESIVIPNDNVVYSIGYYKSHLANEFNWIQINMTHNTLGTYHWSQGTNFSLPDTVNQWIQLYSDVKKSSANSNFQMEGDPETFLLPDYAINPNEK